MRPVITAFFLLSLMAALAVARSAQSEVVVIRAKNFDYVFDKAKGTVEARATTLEGEEWFEVRSLLCILG